MAGGNWTAQNKVRPGVQPWDPGRLPRSVLGPGGADDVH